MWVEQINRSHLRCPKVKRFVKQQASRLRRRQFKRFLLTGKEPERRVTKGWVD